MNYGPNDPLPPVGTRVEHEEYGPGTIVGPYVDHSQWYVEFDHPLHTLASGKDARRGWVWPYDLVPVEPTTPLAAPKLPAVSTGPDGSEVSLSGLMAGMGDLDLRLVRAEIAMRLIRVAAGNLAGTPYSGAFRVLEEAKSVLGPATNGINGAGVGYAVEYVERFLDTLAELGVAQR